MERYIFLTFIVGIVCLLLSLPGRLPFVGMVTMGPYPMNVTIASYIDLGLSNNLSTRVEFTKGAAGRGITEPVDTNTFNNNATWNWNGTGPGDVGTEYFAAISNNTNEPTVDLCTNADNDLWDLPLQHSIKIENVTFASSLYNNNTHPSLSDEVPLTVSPSWVTMFDDLTPPIVGYNKTYLRYWFDCPPATPLTPAGQYNTTYAVKAIRGSETC